MKKITNLFLFFVFIASSAIAQIPMFFNTNVNAGGNAFPLANATTSRKVQWFIPPNSLGAVSAGNNITDVYFQCSVAGSNTYPNINVKLKTGTGTGLTGVAAGPIEPGMITVYAGTNVMINATAGSWIKFTLQTPWLYNPAVPLIVELEHDATTTSGPTLCQAVNIPGPGNGRQWANYNAATLTSTGLNQINFGIDVIPATPCTTAPAANASSPSSFTTCTGFTNPGLSIASSYSFGGITYQWYSSTVSPVGLYNAIPGATMHIAPTPTLGTTTWFQVVATCTNPGGGSTTLTPSQYYVPTGNVINTVPYTEDFEGIQINNRLPNCSWYAANLGTTVNSYTSAATGNRVPRSGNQFAGFSLPSTNNIVYTNGITMNPGITYSVALWYATEYLGGSNWTDLSILVGPNQTPAGLVQVANTSPAISGAYKKLSGLFTVPSAGDYYVAIKATGASGAALYLSWDDLSVTIPCDGSGSNTPTLNVTASTQSICTGQALSLNASGADTYTWNTGANTAGLTETPQLPGLANYVVTGSNMLTGCTSVFSQSILVMPSPVVVVAASPATVCIGQLVQLSGIGNAVSYLWSNGGAAPAITTTISSATTFTLIGTGANGCTSEATQAVSVFTLPIVGATSSIPGEACNGDVINLTGSGALSYKWISNTAPNVLQGNIVNVNPSSTTVYTVTGTDGNGCSSKYTLTQNVNECVSIKEHSGSISGLMIYPNPTNAAFTVELNASLKTIEVIDLTGKVVLTNTSSEAKTNINISTLASGVYYVKVKTNNTVEVIKVVKN